MRLEYGIHGPRLVSDAGQPLLPDPPPSPARELRRLARELEHPR
jgi:hypothetical protein